MKSMRILLWTFLLTGLWASTITRVGTTAAPFLKIGVGARALGMGEAVVTQTTDVSSMFWNPAGLGFMKKPQAIMNHYEMFAGLDYDYMGVAFPSRSMGTIGFNFTHYGGDDIERTTEYEQEGTGELVSYGFFSVGISYARALTDRFSIGCNTKYVKEKIWHMSDNGFAVDVGIYYRTLFRNVTIGMNMANFGTSMQLMGRDVLVQHDTNGLVNGDPDDINAYLATDEFNLPIYFRVGISANLGRDFLQLEGQDIILAIDAVHPNDNSEYVNAGLEYRLMDMVSIRTGHRMLFLDDAEGGFTIGGGLNLQVAGFGLELDYAAVDFGILGNTHKYTLILSF